MYSKKALVTAPSDTLFYVFVLFCFPQLLVLCFLPIIGRSFDFNSSAAAICDAFELAAFLCLIVLFLLRYLIRSCLFVQEKNARKYGIRIKLYSRCLGNFVWCPPRMVFVTSFNVDFLETHMYAF